MEQLNINGIFALEVVDQKPKSISGPYPIFPGFRGTDTSRQAAESMKPSKARLQLLVLEELGRAPATSFELADRLRLPYASIQPRTSELREEGKIADSGDRRPGPSGRNAIVWRIS